MGDIVTEPSTQKKMLKITNHTKFLNQSTTNPLILEMGMSLMIPMLNIPLLNNHLSPKLVQTTIQFNFIALVKMPLITSLSYW